MDRRRDRERYARDLAYLSPPAMVAAATGSRLAGDWRGACAAALVDPHVDLRDVAARYGAAEAARIEADLLGFAPDLLRRFLPRTDALALAPGARVVLSRLTTPFPAGRGGWGVRSRGVPVLVATLPPTDRAPQRVALRVTDDLDLHGTWYDLPAWCWHADAGAERRWAYGGSATRLAWHTVDGRPYRQGETTPPDHPADRAAEFERLIALADEDPVAAYRAAGCTADTSETTRRYLVDSYLAARRSAPALLAAEARRLAHRYGRTTLPGDDARYPLRVHDTGLTIRAGRYGDAGAGPIVFGLRAPMDVALLRFGTLRPDDLHPLVHAALFPDRAQSPSTPEPVTGRTIRVRCGPDWHPLRVLGVRAAAPVHTDAELRREFLLAGLGGPIGGCAAAVRAWRTGESPIPKEVRKLRRRLFALAFHGDTDGLLALLAAGFDPEVRDGQGRTLLHYLHHLDHDRLLPVLLAGGASLEVRDRDGGTPLHAAAGAVATATMAALVDWGADPDAVDGQGRTPDEVLALARKVARR